MQGWRCCEGGSSCEGGGGKGWCREGDIRERTQRWASGAVVRAAVERAAVATVAAVAMMAVAAAWQQRPPQVDLRRPGKADLRFGRGSSV